MRNPPEERIKLDHDWPRNAGWHTHQPHSDLSATVENEYPDNGFRPPPTYSQAFPPNSSIPQAQNMPQHGRRFLSRTVQPLMSVQTFSYMVADAVTTAIRFKSPAGQPFRHVFMDGQFEYDVVWGVSSVRPITIVPAGLQQYPAPGSFFRHHNTMAESRTMPQPFPPQQPAVFTDHRQNAVDASLPSHVMRHTAYDPVGNIKIAINNDNGNGAVAFQSPRLTSAVLSQSSTSSNLWPSDSNLGSINSSQTDSLSDENLAAIEEDSDARKKIKVEADSFSGLRVKTSRIKDTAYYRSHGAIAKPLDGKKREGDRCLTCIKYDRACRGNILKDGSCDTCRAVRNSRNQKRSCLWADPDDDVWTYEAAQQVNGSRKIHNNTTEALSERGKGTLFQQAKADVERAVHEVQNSETVSPNSDAWRLVNGLTEREGDRPDLMMSVLDYPSGSLKREAMVDIVFSCMNAIKSLDGGDDVLSALLNAAEASVAKLTAPNSRGVEDLTKLTNMAETYEAVIQRMKFMKRIGRKIRKEKLRAFLHEDQD